MSRPIGRGVPRVRLRVTVPGDCSDFRGQRRENGTVPVGPEGDWHIFRPATSRKTSQSPARERLRLRCGDRPNTRRRTSTAPRGFSLLEVLLAAAVLLGCVIVLGHLAMLGRQHAIAAEELADAQRIAQARLSEILIGQRPLEPVEDAAPEDEPGWRWSAAVGPAGPPGLIAVEVTVVRDVPEGRPARRFSLRRWVRDPDFSAWPAGSASREDGTAP